MFGILGKPGVVFLGRTFCLLFVAGGSSSQMDLRVFLVFCTKTFAKQVRAVTKKRFFLYSYRWLGQIELKELQVRKPVDSFVSEAKFGAGYHDTAHALIM